MKNFKVKLKGKIYKVKANDSNEAIIKVINVNDTPADAAWAGEMWRQIYPLIRDSEFDKALRLIDMLVEDIKKAKSKYRK